MEWKEVTLCFNLKKYCISSLDHDAFITVIKIIQWCTESLYIMFYFDLMHFDVGGKNVGNNTIIVLQVYHLWKNNHLDQNIYIKNA